MPESVISRDVLWTALEQSGLLAAHQLDAAKAAWADSPSLSAADVARQLVRRGWLTRFQADRLLEGRSRGFFFDHYKIVDMLGLGGMGWVYQAVDLNTDEYVALKVLRDDIKLDAGMLARFHQEARVGLRLDHPQIMKTIELGEAGGLPYMIMEFVAGPNLLELLVRRQRLPWEQACDFARQTLEGLDYAHRQGVVHRDVKPQNLLIDSAGRVRLLDFGLSMLKEGESGDEFSLAMIFGHEGVGTFEFAAPEQVADSLAADARSDIYGVGASLFAAITGVNAISSADLQLGRHDKQRSMREFAPQAPDAVAQIVSKMLDPDPARRFAAAAEAAAALAPWAKPAPVEFDFAEILLARKQDAQQRLKRMTRQESGTSRLSQSTARPVNISSVAKAVGREASAPPSSSVETSASPASIRGPASRWAQDASPADKSPASLVMLDARYAIPLRQDQIRIGRSDDCELQLTDGAVSSRHCEIRFDGRRWRIEDLQSRNGTVVNGRPVRRQRLKSGDVIVVGNVQRFRFEMSDTRAATPAQRTIRAAVWVFAAFAAIAVVGYITTLLF